MDELDRVLGADEGLKPSSGFTRRVMEELARQSAPPPIPFPWVRVMPALVGAVGIVVAFAVYLAIEPWGSGGGVELATWLEHPVAAPVGWAALSLVGSWVAFRMSMRMAGPLR